MNVHIGMIINDDFIENMATDVEIEGYQEFQITENSAKHFSADGDEKGTFWEALQYATKAHFEIWERDHEYKDVTSKVEGCIRHKLEEEGFINRWKDADPLTCAFGELFDPLRVTEGHVAAIKRCLLDAAFGVAWLKSESLQLFFQTENPCCWDGKPPKERYGKEWVEDTETRLILMIHENQLISGDVLERVYQKGHTLRGNADRGCGIVEYDTEGNQYEPYSHW